MSFLSNIFGGKKKTAATADAAAAAVECPHMALGPRWDSAADIGHEDRATSFICGTCHRVFAPADVERLRTEAAQHLRTDA